MTEKDLISLFKACCDELCMKYAGAEKYCINCSVSNIFIKEAKRKNLIKQESEYLTWHEFIDAVLEENEFDYKLKSNDNTWCEFGVFDHFDLRVLKKKFKSTKWRIKQKSLKEQIKEKINEYENIEKDVSIKSGPVKDILNKLFLCNTKFVYELTQLIDKLED